MLVTRRSRLKKELVGILRLADCSEIFELLQGYKENDLLGHLFSTLCHTEDRVRWHAVTAFGQIVDRITRKNLEAARDVMRRLLWSLNDESGGIGWGAPEAMAEVMVRSEILFEEYIHMLLSYMRADGPELFQDGNYIELPELQRGVIWGVGRLAGKYGKILIDRGVIDDLLPFLSSSDGVVRGVCIWSLGMLKALPAKKMIQEHLDDQGAVTLYQQGDIYKTTVSNLAKEALDILNISESSHRSSKIPAGS
jgi:hypothetical protein